MKTIKLVIAMIAISLSSFSQSLTITGNDPLSEYKTVINNHATKIDEIIAAGNDTIYVSSGGGGTGATSGSEVTLTDRLIVGDGSSTKYDLTYREGVGLVVPTFIPNSTNKVIALDIMPSGTPTENGTNGFAWVDICDADLKSVQNPTNCARMGVRSGFVEFGSRAFNGRSVKNLSLTMGGNPALTITPNYSIVLPYYGTSPYTATYLNKTLTEFIVRIATDGTLLKERSAINKIALSISDTGTILLNNSNYTGSIGCSYTTVYTITISGVTIPNTANIICTLNSGNWNHSVSANVVNGKAVVYVGDLISNQLTADAFSINIDW